MTNYEWATPVEKIGREVVAKSHPHLIKVDIAYLFRERAAKRKGRKILATAGLAPALSQVLAEVRGNESFTFVIIAARDIWADLTDEAKVALVDHELCHCGVDKLGNPKILSHDVEEFKAIVDRHGLWYADLQEFAGATKQGAETQLSLLKPGKDGEADARS